MKESELRNRWKQGCFETPHRNDKLVLNRLRFVQKAVALALSRDGSSGGMVRTLVITKDEASRGDNVLVLDRRLCKGSDT